MGMSPFLWIEILCNTIEYIVKANNSYVAFSSIKYLFYYCEESTGQQHLLTRRFYDCYRFQEMASKFENALQDPQGIAQQGNDVW